MLMNALSAGINAVNYYILVSLFFVSQNMAYQFNREWCNGGQIFFVVYNER